MQHRIAIDGRSLLFLFMRKPGADGAEPDPSSSAEVYRMIVDHAEKATEKSLYERLLGDYLKLNLEQTKLVQLTIFPDVKARNK
jgi:hypothetical protein